MQEEAPHSKSTLMTSNSAGLTYSISEGLEPFSRIHNWLKVSIPELGMESDSSWAYSVPQGKNRCPTSLVANESQEDSRSFL